MDVPFSVLYLVVQRGPCGLRYDATPSGDRQNHKRASLRNEFSSLYSDEDVAEPLHRTRCFLYSPVGHSESRYRASVARVALGAQAEAVISNLSTCFYP